MNDSSFGKSLHGIKATARRSTPSRVQHQRVPLSRPSDILQLPSLESHMHASTTPWWTDPTEFKKESLALNEKVSSGMDEAASCSVLEMALGICSIDPHSRQCVTSGIMSDEQCLVEMDVTQFVSIQQVKSLF